MTGILTVSSRAWKLRLIEESNPEWRDLWEEIIG
jgi:putative endonuclease